jgi:hypothetical protein
VIRSRGLLNYGLVFHFLAAEVVISVLVAMLRLHPEEVPVKMRSLVVSRRFMETCADVGMREAHPLEKKRRDQE